MAQKKANEVEAWLRQPPADMAVVLLYGPDRGLVSERAARLAAAWMPALDDPFAVMRLDADSLEDQPGRLVEEADTLPMFSDRRMIWVKGLGAQRKLADDIRQVCETRRKDVFVLLEGGDLKKSAGARSAVEASPHAMALPCYADQGRGIDALIDEELSRAGLTMTIEARQLLRQSLGGDRMASRSELDKLMLYAAGSGTIGIDDVRDSVGDVSARSLDDTTDALLSGDRAACDAALARHLASGAQPFLILSALMRQFQQLQALSAQMSDGRSATSVVASARPPVFFSRRKLVEEALQRWSPEALATGLARLQDTVLATRRRPELADALTRHTMMALLSEGARYRRGA